MKYKFFGVLILTFLVVFLGNVLKAEAIIDGSCEATHPAWSLSGPVPWKTSAASQLFSMTQQYTERGPVETLTNSCTAVATNDATCQVGGISMIRYQDYDPCPLASDRVAIYISPVNRIDTLPPICGSWADNGSGSYTLSGSTDAPAVAPSGMSGINVAGGTCTAIAGNSCNFTISDVATNTKVCTSPVYVPPPPLTGTCSASPNLQNINQPVIWTASPSGGTGSYTYSWTGTDGLVGTTNSITKSYSTIGTKIATVTITSGTQTVAPSCSVLIQAGGTYALTIITAGTGSGTTIPSGSPSPGTPHQYTSGTVVSLSGTPTGSTGPVWSGGNTLSPNDCVDGTVTINNADITCTATFTISVIGPFTVTGTQGANCNISPSSRTVNNNATTTFTVTPNSGYTASASGCGGSLSGTTYTTGPITANCTVSATCALSATPMPDLTAGAITPTVATKNIPLTFESTISNIGNASTNYLGVNNFYNFFQVATQSNGGGTKSDLNPVSMSTVGIGASKISTSPSYTFTTSGVKSVRACADKSDSADTGTITESNEGNNCGPWTDMTVTDNALPDLIASAPTPSTDATVNVARTYTSTILNQGTASTGKSFFNFFQLSSPWYNEAGATFYDLTPSSMNALAAGGNAPTTYSIPFTSSGHKSIRVCADKSNSADLGLIAEGSETNNCSPWTNVTVNPPPPSNLVLSCPSPGTTVNASWTAPSGWNTFYFRANPGADVVTYPSAFDDDTLVGTSKTFPSTPGQTYHVWVNTRDPANGYWSPEVVAGNVICASSGPSGTLTADSCTIPLNASTCSNTNVTWTTANLTPGATEITRNNPDFTHVSWLTSGTNVDNTVNYGLSTFYLYHNISGVPTKLAEATINVSCESGGWNGTVCVTTPIDGGWSDYGACSVSCGGGIQTRTCTNPVPANGGASCVGKTWQQCNIQSCSDPVSGACSSPATHYNCSVGTPTNTKSSPSKWTWTCTGSNGGADASCSQKRSPGFIEN